MAIVSLSHRLCAFYRAYYITDTDGSLCQAYGGLEEEAFSTLTFGFFRS